MEDSQVRNNDTALLLAAGPSGTSGGRSAPTTPAHPAPDAEAGDKCGVIKTMGNLFIAFVGAGILGLPYAFMRSGIVLGSTFMVVLALLAYYCTILLVDCKRKLVSNGVVTYPDVVESALGAWGRFVVQTFLILSQTGFCVAYLIFITNNIGPMSGWGKVAIVLTVLPFQILLAMLRDLSALAPFSLLADAAHVVGMIVVLRDDLENYTTAHETVVASKGIAAVPFLFGVVIYCYEGIGMILPIEDSMRDRSKFKPTLTLSFSIITTVFLLFGLTGYAAFGEHTEDIITNNLPDDWTSDAVRLALCCALFFTFPIMMVPVYEITERSLYSTDWFEKTVGPSRRWLVFKFLRCTTVGLVGLVAVSVPGFGVFISFIGSFCCATLAFILPSVCHLVIFYDKLSFAAKAMDYFLLAFGVIGMVFGVGESVEGLINGGGAAHG